VADNDLFCPKLPVIYQEDSLTEVRVTVDIFHCDHYYVNILACPVTFIEYM